MIIALPIEAAKPGRKHRVALFHFSNNNLAIRRSCSAELGGYDPESTTSEDVDICFRLIRHPSWVACREPGMVIRHKSRSTVPAMLKQMWGWGIRLGHAYVKTNLRGTHFYWVSRKGPAITQSIELPRTPGFICIYLTDFHLMHILGVLTAALTILGMWSWAIGAGIATAAVAMSYLAVVWTQPLSIGARIKLALAHYVSNLAFITASFLGGLRCKIILIPASIFPPNEPSQR